MKYLVQPLVSSSANAPGSAGADGRIFTIASEVSGLVLAARDELQWQLVPGSLRQLDVGVDGAVWGVNAADQVLRWTGDAWQVMPGALAQISVGSASRVWGVAPDQTIWRWDGDAWQQVPGGLRQVAVAADGAAWGVNAAAEVFRWTGSGWAQVAGALKQIAVGDRTTVWGVDLQDRIWVRQGDHWQQIDGGLMQVSAAADGAIWGVSASEEVWRWRGGWEKTPGGLTQVAAGSASEVWGISGDGLLWRNAGAGHGRVVQQIWTEDPRQQWRFRALGDSTFRIDNVATGESLDVRASSQEYGADLLAWPWHGGPNQRWWIIDLGDARFRLAAVHSGQSLSIQGGSLEAGATIVQHPWQAAAHQRWRLAEVRPTSVIADLTATLYTGADYLGASLRLGVGAFDLPSLAAIGNDTVSALRVPAGLRVTLFAAGGFQGERRSFTADAPWVGVDFNDVTSSVIVEKVATIYAAGDYQGASASLGVGRYDASQLGIPNDSLSSLRVPQGMAVILHEHVGFDGRQRVYFEDAPLVTDGWNDRTSSLEVVQLGVVIPRDAIRFGGQLRLRGPHGAWLRAGIDGSIAADAAAAASDETFIVERAGPTQHLSHLAYGDVIALRSAHGKVVAAGEDGVARADHEAIGPDARWLVVRAGASASTVFVSHGDVIALRSWQERHLVAEAGGAVHAQAVDLDPSGRWTIGGYGPPNQEADSGGGPCGAAVCGANVCAAEACGADACGAEACGADAALIGACAVAAAGVALCGADVAVVSACGAALTGAGACGAAACGAAACGADACAAAAAGVGACGAAACAAAACGVAACGADACGAAACGIDAGAAGACGADACGVEAGPIEICGLDACAANVCLINACPIDACAADACAADVVPIFPGI